MLYSKGIKIDRLLSMPSVLNLPILKLKVKWHTKDIVHLYNCGRRDGALRKRIRNIDMGYRYLSWRWDWSEIWTRHHCIFEKSSSGIIHQRDWISLFNPRISTCYNKEIEILVYASVFFYILSSFAFRRVDKILKHIFFRLL